MTPNRTFPPGGGLSDLQRRLDIEAGAFVFVVSGPSGAGKSTLCEAVLAADPGVRSCVTTTTRRRRPGEVEGVDYHFVPEDEFRRKLDRGEFVEWAEVYGFLYGATVEAVARALEGGKVMLVDVDVQGAKNWKETLGDRCVSAFVLPPSLDVLRSRLARRNTEKEGALQRRLDQVRPELDRAETFDYLIVNQDLERAVSELQSMITSERCRPRRMTEALARLRAG